MNPPVVTLDRIGTWLVLPPVLLCLAGCPAAEPSPPPPLSPTPQLPIVPATGRASWDQPRPALRVPTADLPAGFVYRNETGARRFMSAGGPAENQAAPPSSPQVFLPLGINYAWPTLPNSALEYELTVPLLAKNGVNLIRIWHSTWGLNLGGWNPTGALDGPGVEALDRVFKSAEKHGVKVLLVYDNHFDVLNNQKRHRLFTSSGAAGAVCATAADYFSLPAARAIHAARVKAILARWGNSPAFFGLEMFNELDLALSLDADHPANRAMLEDWAHFMAAVVWQEREAKNRAAWHPIGVSTAFPGTLRSAYDRYFDFVPVHQYIPETMGLRYDRDLNETQLIAESCLYFIPERPVGSNGTRRLPSRPWLMEYGFASGGSTSARNKDDPGGVHLRHALWASVAAGGEGCAMPWWWDSYLFPRGLTQLYRPLADTTAGLPWDRAEAAYLMHRPAAVVDAAARGKPSPAPTGTDYFAYGTQWNDAAFLYLVRDDCAWINQTASGWNVRAAERTPRKFELDAGALTLGRYAVEWIDPATGRAAGASAVIDHAGGHLLLTTPVVLDDLAVVVHRVE